jgi:hypothetical protein
VAGGSSAAVFVPFSRSHRIPSAGFLSPPFALAIYRASREFELEKARAALKGQYSCIGRACPRSSASLARRIDVIVDRRGS